MSTETVTVDGVNYDRKVLRDAARLLRQASTQILKVANSSTGLDGQYVQKSLHEAWAAIDAARARL